MTLEGVYWLTLGTGLGLLILTLVLGEVFDALDFLDIDIGGSEVALAPVFFTAVSAFGAGGLIGIEGLGMGEAGSIGVGLGTGIGAGGLTGLLFALLHRQESRDAFELSKLVGERGLCTLTIGPGRTGRVSVSYAGMTRALSASSDEEIATGQDIVVKDVIGSRLIVAAMTSKGEAG